MKYVAFRPSSVLHVLAFTTVLLALTGLLPDRLAVQASALFFVYRLLLLAAVAHYRARVPRVAGGRVER